MNNAELTPDQVDELRQQATLNELVEQGGIRPRDDDPFDPSLISELTPEEKRTLALAHDYRDARKLQYVINLDDLTPAEIAKASAAEVQGIIEEKFETKHRLQFFPSTSEQEIMVRKNDPYRHALKDGKRVFPTPERYEAVEQKTLGQQAEEVLTQLINEAELNAKAEYNTKAVLGSDYQDNIGKADIMLFIPIGNKQEVLLKVQAKSSLPKDAVERFRRVNPNALLVQLSDMKRLDPFVTEFDQDDPDRWAKALIAFMDRSNKTEKRMLASDYLGSVLASLGQTSPNIYSAAKRALSRKK